MKTPRGASESSTTSDNTTEFIDIVKKYDVVYNTHNPDYKNVEVKMKVWSQIAEEIGLSVDASKRKWKNLRDSYTKYLRSFRIGTKTSKKYQYWAHAEHMDFLKPYQGPGRNSSNSNGSNGKTNDDEDTECDLGFQVLTKATTTTSSEEDLKITVTTNAAPTPAVSAAAAAQTMATIIPPAMISALPATTTTATAMPATCSTPPLSVSSATLSAAFTNTTSNIAPSGDALVMPVPSLPTVQLPLPPPQIGIAGGKAMLTAPLTALPATSMPAQLFPLSQQLSNSVGKAAIAMPASSTASSVGCLIIEPQLFASADTFKKELCNPALGLFHNVTSQATATTATTRVNPPLITKIRRVQPSPQTAAINLSFSATSAPAAAAPQPPPPPPAMIIQPPPAKTRKLNDRPLDVDVAAILHANRDLDANTLFFLSLAKSVRAMPTKCQSLAKMRCMRIVSDLELELDNVNDCQGPPPDDCHSSKFCSLDSPPPPPPDGTVIIQNVATVNDVATEHFVYVMSPSRVESMIDISSDEEATLNGN